MALASVLVCFANEEIMQQVKDSISKGLYFVPVNDAWELRRILRIPFASFGKMTDYMTSVGKSSSKNNVTRRLSVLLTTEFT